MKKSILAGLIVLLGLAFVVPVGQVIAAKEFVFKYSNSQSDTHPRSLSMLA